MAILKNTATTESSNIITLPSGTTAERPQAAPNGAVRYNTTLGLVEVYNNNGWYDITNGNFALDAVPTTYNTGVFVRLWGAGGGGGRPGGWNQGAEGGAGGHTWGWLTGLTAGQTLILQVGGGGQLGGTTSAFPGGGTVIGGGDNRYGSAGGGYTGLFLGSVSQANAIMIAGGGGGGGSSRAGEGNRGGAGGGRNGQDGLSPFDGKWEYRGKGGSQTAAGVSNPSRDPAGNSVAQNSSDQQGALQGGRCTAGSGYGGGGGGGYWGGSGGGYSESNTMSGGGGGSGYLNNLYVAGGGTLTGRYRDPVNPPGASLAYGGTVSGAGNNGYAIITRNGVDTTYSYTGSNVTITF
jgi:hypothetical protein